MLGRWRKPTRHGRLRTREELGLPKWSGGIEGSFDDPPIVVRQDRLTTSLLSLSLLPMVAWLCFVPGPYSGVRLLYMGAVGIIVVLGVAVVVFPAVLILDPEGLTLRTPFRAIEYPWRRFARFYVRSINHVKWVVAESSETLAPRYGWRRGNLRSAWADCGTPPLSAWPTSSTRP
ncbi:MAG: hypothetical protein U1E23_02140 [Reyranellaceae bacterium]